MEIRRVQYILPACVHPFFFWELLAHRAASVPAGIIVDRDTAAVFAYTDIDTKGARLAVHDVVCGFLLHRGQFMGSFISRVKVVKNILDGIITAHDAPPCCPSNGLRIPRRVLLLTCRYTSVERGSTWPRRDWIYLISTPLSNKWLAKLWRQAWEDTRLVMPARFALALKN